VAKASIRQKLLMLALLCAAPVALYIGLLLPGFLSPFIGLSERSQSIQQASAALVLVLYAATMILALAGRFRRSLHVLAAALLAEVLVFVVIAFCDGSFRQSERIAAIQERFEAAAATYPRQAWCAGGFAYVRQNPGEVDYDVMMHPPPASGLVALRVGQFRVHTAEQSCDTTLFSERHAEAARWFATCPDARDAFESFVDMVRNPTDCPWPRLERWPKAAAGP
jgi:hypothetical protein